MGENVAARWKRHISQSRHIYIYDNVSVSLGRRKGTWIMFNVNTITIQLCMSSEKEWRKPPHTHKENNSCTLRFTEQPIYCFHELISSMIFHPMRLHESRRKKKEEKKRIVSESEAFHAHIHSIIIIIQHIVTMTVLFFILFYIIFFFWPHPLNIFIGRHKSPFLVAFFCQFISYCSIHMAS